MKGKIFLLEDDENLGYLLKESLSDQGFDVKWYKDGNEAWENYEPGTFALCIVDIIVPGIDGVEVVKKIKRADKYQAVIFLTARSLRSDVISGYQAGADDYIVKPFETYELLLKIKAIMSRVNGQNESKPEVLSMGLLKLDPKRQLLISEDGEIKINRIECEILNSLMAANGDVVTRNFLLESIWERNDMYTSKSLDTYLSRIRRLLRNSGLSLVNIYGRGYILNEKWRVENGE